jgi:hypothetical protein
VVTCGLCGLSPETQKSKLLKLKPIRQIEVLTSKSLDSASQRNDSSIGCKTNLTLQKMMCFHASPKGKNENVWQQNSRKCGIAQVKDQYVFGLKDRNSEFTVHGYE